MSFSHTSGALPIGALRELARRTELRGMAVGDALLHGAAFFNRALELPDVRALTALYEIDTLMSAPSWLARNGGAA
jgi:hypothetical protein